MEVYIVRKYMSPEEGVYLNETKAQIECNKLNSKYVVPMYHVKIVSVIE
jgi:hypothetical protein